MSVTDDINPFQADGVWLKSALHTHSTGSDGTVGPEHLANAYREAGFDVLAITDHWRLTKVGSDDRLVTVPAAELGFDMRKPRYPRQSLEFLVYGIDHVPDDPGGDRANWYSNPVEHYEVRTFPDLGAGVRWADEQGAVVYVAHPYWNQMGIDELLAFDGYTGIEVYNGSSDLENGRGDSSPWWDTLLGAGRQVFGIGTDDQHYPLFELGTGWTMLRAADRTPEAALDALRSGSAYFSHGPRIDEVVVDGSTVEVACSAARSVLLQMEEERGVNIAAGRGGRRFGRVLDTDDRDLLRRVRLESPWDEVRYRRVVVVDEHGRRAWTNPL